MGKKVHQIVLSGDNSMFEEIQNEYSLYDNCVFEGDDDEGTIIIEGSVLSEVKDLCKELKKKGNYILNYLKGVRT